MINTKPSTIAQILTIRQGRRRDMPGSGPYPFKVPLESMVFQEDPKLLVFIIV
jgi:hypothetical protein